MTADALPPQNVMMAAFLDRNADYDGIFFTGVRTTGIFCRPVCPARKPHPENVEFFATAQDALFSGYRPCRRCLPLRGPGEAPDWVAPLLAAVEAEPTRRWTAADLRARGLHPDRVRRWFQSRHGMTFSAYARARRLGAALRSIRDGTAVSSAAFEHGYDSLSGFNSAFREVVGSSPSQAARGPVVWLRHLETPLGPMVAAATDEALCLLEFADRRMLERQIRTLARKLSPVFAPGAADPLRRIARELEAYFSTGTADFRTPLLLLGSEFQRSVWESLRAIPAGATVSYAELAARLGRPRAVRAVARANGDNRLAIVVPCHRVIGSDGALTGYGGGLWRKRRLLELERGAADGPGPEAVPQRGR